MDVTVCAVIITAAFCIWFFWMKEKAEYVAGQKACRLAIHCGCDPAKIVAHSVVWLSPVERGIHDAAVEAMDDGS